MKAVINKEKENIFDNKYYQNMNKGQNKNISILNNKSSNCVSFGAITPPE